MTWIVMTCLMIAAAMGQMFVPAFTVLGQVKTPFLMSVVLYYALQREYRVMIVSACVAGILQDTLGQIPLGYSVFCFFLMGVIVSRFQGVVMTETVLTTLFFGGLCAIAVTIGIGGLLAGVGLVRYPLGRALLKALGAGVLGGLCTPIVMGVARVLDGMAGNVKEKEEVHGFQ